MSTTPSAIATPSPRKHTRDSGLIGQSIKLAFLKLDPRRMIRNPVMFVVEVGAALTTLLFIHAAITGEGDAPASFILIVSLWLWFTALFANFAEAMAEGRGKAQAATLRKARRDVMATRLVARSDMPIATLRKEAERVEVTSAQLVRGDIVLVEAGALVPGDGEVIEGVASVDESAITGESAPVIRESGGDRAAVTGGTRVLSDWLVVRITANAGETFLDRMIAMVEGARRTKTPNEIALDILLAALSIIFLLAVVTLRPMSEDAVAAMGRGDPIAVTVMVALVVCLIPTTIGGLLSAIGIAGMDRLVQKNVLATSGRAVEAAGDVDVLLLDKTGTITLGNRQAVAFHAAPGVRLEDLIEAANLASLPDETPEGRSVVVLASSKIKTTASRIESMTFVPFSAETRMSGVDLPQGSIRKGASDAVAKWLATQGRQLPAQVVELAREVARRGATPLVVADLTRALGVIELKDVVKEGIRDRFAELRRLGIKTIMVTGDNPLTAAAIAAEAGVDDFLAEATPEAKLELIRSWQRRGHLVAMTGDGTNDAPALAQADVAVAMNSGTQAAKEAGNMVDLDSNPTKLLDVVRVGKELLVTRGALTTFSIANDVSKYFAVIPAAFATTYPELGALDVMDLGSPATAVLSAVIFNALIIVALIPVALRGVRVKPAPSSVLLRKNLLVFGLGGLILPFPCIKLIDLVLSAIGGI